MTLFQNADHLYIGTVSSTTLGTYWPLTDLFQIIQSWNFQDFNGLCLTEGQQDRLLTLKFLAPLPEGGREARETSSRLSVKTRWNTQKLQPKVDSAWVWMPSTWIGAPEISSETSMNMLKSLGKTKFASSSWQWRTWEGHRCGNSHRNFMVYVFSLIWIQVLKGRVHRSTSLVISHITKKYTGMSVHPTSYTHIHIYVQGTPMLKYTGYPTPIKFLF